jgi:GTP 3',8-cyclase
VKIVRLPIVGTHPGPPIPGAAGLPVAGPVPAPVPGAPLVDRFARTVRYLRVSVTDRCNYRCVYCMPDDVTFRARAELLTFEEIVRLLRVFAGLGVRRVRLTGGEPTVRADLVRLVRMIAEVAGIDEIAMTTNGHVLADQARPLADAGLGEVNVSIDTADPDRFHEVTGRGDLGRVLAGIDAARAAGLGVKLNAVALRGVNDDEIAGLCQLAWDRGLVVRFIEHMPMSAGRLYAAERELDAAQIRAAVAARWGALVPSDPPGRPRGPARYWHLAADPSRQVGIISAITEHFCDTCNRVRLSATGDLHACLGHDDAISLRDVIRGGGDDDQVRAAIGLALAGKREGHEFQRSGAGAPKKHMVAIGG